MRIQTRLFPASTACVLLAVMTAGCMPFMEEGSVSNSYTAPQDVNNFSVEEELEHGLTSLEIVFTNTDRNDMRMATTLTKRGDSWDSLVVTEAGEEIHETDTLSGLSDDDIQTTHVYLMTEMYDRDLFDKVEYSWENQFGEHDFSYIID